MLDIRFQPRPRNRSEDIQLKAQASIFVIWLLLNVNVCKSGNHANLSGIDHLRLLFDRSIEVILSLVQVIPFQLHVDVPVFNQL